MPITLKLMTITAYESSTNKIDHFSMSISNKTYFGALEPPFPLLMVNTSNLINLAIGANTSAISTIKDYLPHIIVNKCNNGELGFSSILVLECNV